MELCEPCQVWKEAALSRYLHVLRGSPTGANCFGAASCLFGKAGCAHLLRSLRASFFMFYKWKDMGIQ